MRGDSRTHPGGRRAQLPAEKPWLPWRPVHRLLSLTARELTQLELQPGGQVRPPVLVGRTGAKFQMHLHHFFKGKRGWGQSSPGPGGRTARRRLGDATPPTAGPWGRLLAPSSPPPPWQSARDPRGLGRLSRECMGFKLENKQKSLNQDGTTVMNTKQESLSVEVRH